jgi:hypothetical protein
MEISSHPVPTTRNPLGTKGAGEAGTVGAVPAIVDAVMDALASLGVKSLEMPPEPDQGTSASLMTSKFADRCFFPHWEQPEAFVERLSAFVDKND